MSTKLNMNGVEIVIEVMTGGFVLTYPVITGDDMTMNREVFASPRKLQNKIKEVLAAVSLVSDTAE